MCLYNILILLFIQLKVLFFNIFSCVSYILYLLRANILILYTYKNIFYAYIKFKKLKFSLKINNFIHDKQKFILCPTGPTFHISVKIKSKQFSRNVNYSRHVNNFKVYKPNMFLSISMEIREVPIISYVCK